MIQRREFNKLAALAAASAVAQARAQQTSPTSKPAPADGISWDKAPCRFCGTGCHVRVGVKEGRVVAIEGDQLAEVNKGLLCVKGYHVGLALYGKDRLTQPLLRRNGVLEPISWEEAIETISQRVLAAPDKFAIYGSGQWTIPEGYAANKFIKGGLSSNHIDPNARLCMASAVTGFLSVYDRGRNGTLSCAAPPSEPDWRISRIRLSSWRVTASKIALLAGRQFIKPTDP